MSSTRCLVAVGILALAFAGGCVGISSSETAQQLYSKDDSTVLHTLPLQALLENLQTTIGALRNAQGRRFDVLLHKATQEAWEALQLVAGPQLTSEPKPEMATFRRRLQAAATQAGIFPANLAGMFPSSLTNVIVDRIKSASQLAVQMQSAARQGIHQAIEESLTDTDRAFLKTAANTLEAEVTLSNLLEKIMEDLKTHNPQLSANSENNARRLQETSITSDVSSKTRRLKTADGIESKSKEPAEIAESLEEKLSGTLEALRARITGAVNKAGENFESRTKNLAERYQALRDRLKRQSEAAIDNRRRRLKQVAEVEEDYAEDDDLFYAEPSYDPSWDDEGVLVLPMPNQVHTNTVVILMQPEDAEESAAFVQDVLALLAEALQISTPLEQLLPELFDPVETTDLWAPSSEWFASPASEEDESLFERKRRRMLSNGPPMTGGRVSTQVEQPAFDDYDDYDTWIWGIEDEDWLMEPYEEDGDDVGRLAVSLLTPMEQGGVSPVFLRLLANSDATAVATLLELLASAPVGGEIRIQGEVPRFAVFGPSVSSNGNSLSSASTSMFTDTDEAYGRMSEVIVLPLSAAARGPRPHSDRDAPGEWDMRWWGVGLSAGVVGLLLAGTALATLRMGPSQAAQALGRDDSVRGGVQSRKDGREGPATPLSPWEGKGEKDLLKAKIARAEGATLRKTSNLPA